jgi:hypothetical protein
MGARVFFNIKQDENTWISLYSHWGEDSRHVDLAHAISKARPRWSDASYATRIIVSQLIGPEWDSETGFGLWAGTEGIYDETSIDVDLVNQIVSDESGVHSFKSFCEYHGYSVDKEESAMV